jgi:hypothetical protein
MTDVPKDPGKNSTYSHDERNGPKIDSFGHQEMSPENQERGNEETEKEAPAPTQVIPSRKDDHFYDFSDHVVNEIKISDS